MKISRILFLSFISLIFAFTAFSQAKFEFENEKHDFGNVSEGAIASYDFTFKNNGTTPLVISNVKASCGCTTPYWSKEPILPGESGKITASYNSKNRSGSFNKSITITSNATVSSKIIFIKGIVVRDNRPITHTLEQKALSPKIFIKKPNFTVGKAAINQVIPIDVTIHNTGKSDLVLAELTANCKCITYDSATPRVIPPNDSRVVRLLFSSQEKGDLEVAVNIHTNDITKPKAILKILAEVVENLGNESIIKNDDVIKF